MWLYNKYYSAGNSIFFNCDFNYYVLVSIHGSQWVNVTGINSISLLKYYPEIDLYIAIANKQRLFFSKDGLFFQKGIFVEDKETIFFRFLSYNKGVFLAAGGYEDNIVSNLILYRCQKGIDCIQ